MWGSYKCTTKMSGGSLATNLTAIKVPWRKTDYLSKSIAIIKLLAKLGLPFHGHREDSDSEATGNYRSTAPAKSFVA